MHNVHPPTPAIDTSLFSPGIRLAVGLSGGADSVALLRALMERSRELGLVLHAAHLHHGLRGEEADADRGFCRELAMGLGLPFHEARVNTAAEALADRAGGKAAETIEEAARRLRYAWFRELMASGVVDAVATAHTLDDQAETVLAKFLRGAWTEGLSGIHPVVRFPEGRILRPLLGTSRADIEAYLGRLGQGWREDSSNRHLTFTRNRIRHELLPLLEEWNPRLREHLAQMAELARDEEAWWEAELGRLAPQLILPGRPVRGGGRAGGEGLAMEVSRLAELPVAVQRRVLRHAAERMGAAPDFEATEALRDLALTGRAGQRCELAQGLRGERTHRELRLTAGGGTVAEGGSGPMYMVEVPGEIAAPEWGIRVRVSMISGAKGSIHSAEVHVRAEARTLEGHEDSPGPKGPVDAGGHNVRAEARTRQGQEDSSGAKALIDNEAVAARLKPPQRRRPVAGDPGKSCPVTKPEGDGRLGEAVKSCPVTEPETKSQAVLRAWKPGDRVRLRHSGRPRKVKEVLERLHVSGAARARWPVLELEGRIVWMQGVDVEPEPGIEIVSSRLGAENGPEGNRNGTDRTRAS